jgi:hypothetical protein
MRTSIIGLSHLVLAFAALVASGCATTMTAGSHSERGLDFARYRTYDWGPADALPTGDPRLDGNPVFKDQLQGAVERELALKGFELAAAGTPDLLIHYHAHVSERIRIGATGQPYANCPGDECLGEVIEYEAGTIVLDIVDTRTNRVIWRGWAQDSVEGILDDPDKLEEKVNESVKRMLARLPSKL